VFFTEFTSPYSLKVQRGWHTSESGVFSVLVGKLARKRPLGRPRNRRWDNIKMDLQEFGVWVWNVSNWLRIGTGGGHL